MHGIGRDCILDILLKICPEKGEVYSYGLNLPYAEHAEFSVVRIPFACDKPNQALISENFRIMMLWKMKGREGRYGVEELVFGSSVEEYGANLNSFCTGVIFYNREGDLKGQWYGSKIGEPYCVSENEPIFFNEEKVSMVYEPEVMYEMLPFVAKETALDKLIIIAECLGLNWSPQVEPSPKMLELDGLS